MTREATLHDGSTIEITIRGDGPAVLLPVRPQPITGAQAETMRQWGADPELGPRMVDGLARSFRVIAADYEGHRMAHPAPATLTPDAVVHDLLAIADAADAPTFAYYGYSWLGLCGLQLAVRTDRLWALAMGGYPPVDGPYAAMLEVTRAAHTMATNAPSAHDGETDAPSTTAGDWDSVQVTSTADQTRQFVTLYETLRGFDDQQAQAGLTVPRMVIVGAADEIGYGPGWGNVHVSIAGPVIRHQVDLRASGWRVDILPGLDHMAAMQVDAVLPVLVDWLGSVARAVQR